MYIRPQAPLYLGIDGTGCSREPVQPVPSCPISSVGGPTGPLFLLPVQPVQIMLIPVMIFLLVHGKTRPRLPMGCLAYLRVDGTVARKEPVQPVHQREI